MRNGSGAASARKNKSGDKSTPYMNELVMEVLDKEPSGLTIEQLAERLGDGEKVRHAIDHLRRKGKISNANKSGSGRAVYRIAKEKPVVVKKVTSNGPYDGHDLTDRSTHRPGAHDHEKYPSRAGRILTYRDGRKEML